MLDEHPYGDLQQVKGIGELAQEAIQAGRPAVCAEIGDNEPESGNRQHLQQDWRETDGQVSGIEDVGCSE